MSKPSIGADGHIAGGAMLSQGIIPDSLKTGGAGTPTNPEIPSDINNLIKDLAAGSTSAAGTNSAAGSTSAAGTSDSTRDTSADGTTSSPVMRHAIMEMLKTQILNSTKTTGSGGEDDAETLDDMRPVSTKYYFANLLKQIVLTKSQRKDIETLLFRSMERATAFEYETDDGTGSFTKDALYNIVCRNNSNKTATFEQIILLLGYLYPSLEINALSKPMLSRTQKFYVKVREHTEYHFLIENKTFGSSSFSFQSYKHE
jgi:hypothetical protein